MGHAPFELRKILHMVKNATLEKLPQWKITKIVATRCQTLTLKCTKFKFGWDSAPDPAGELTVLPRPSSSIQGALLQREVAGRGGERQGSGCPLQIPGYTTGWGSMKLGLLIDLAGTI